MQPPFLPKMAETKSPIPSTCPRRPPVALNREISADSVPKRLLPKQKSGTRFSGVRGSFYCDIYRNIGRKPADEAPRARTQPRLRPAPGRSNGIPAGPRRCVPPRGGRSRPPQCSSGRSSQRAPPPADHPVNRASFPSRTSRARFWKALRRRKRSRGNYENNPGSPPPPALKAGGRPGPPVPGDVGGRTPLSSPSHPPDFPFRYRNSGARGRGDGNKFRLGKAPAYSVLGRRWLFPKHIRARFLPLIDRSGFFATPNVRTLLVRGRRHSGGALRLAPPTII